MPEAIRHPITPTVIAFPPTRAEVAAIAFDVERLPVSKLVPTARRLIGLADDLQADPVSATANLHAIYGAMLMLCRVLDAAAYPWDLAVGSART